MEIKTSYYKKLEYDLYNYKAYKASLRSLEKDLKEIEYDGINSISYDELKVSKTFKFSSVTEDTALSNIERINYIEHIMRKTKNTLDKIDDSLELLTKEERKIIEKRYFEGWQWYDIAYEVKYNERWCRELRKRAMIKMAISIFGKRAVIQPEMD